MAPPLQDNRANGALALVWLLSHECLGSLSTLGQRAGVASWSVWTAAGSEAGTGRAFPVASAAV